MRIVVDKMPENSQECLFKKYYNQNTGWWNCGFFDTSVCSLDCGEECPYLCQMGEILKEYNG